MLSNDVLRQAIEQSRLDYACRSPSTASGSREPEPEYRDKPRRRSHQNRHSSSASLGQKVPRQKSWGRTRVLKPPPEVVHLSSERFNPNVPRSSNVKRDSSEDEQEWTNMRQRSERYEDEGHHFDDSVGRVSGGSASGVGNDCSTNIRSRNGHELSFYGGNRSNHGTISDVRSSNSNTGVVASYSARANNNNNNNNGVVSSFSARTNNNGVVSSFSARANNNNNNNNKRVSSSVSHTNYRSTLKNPIFFTVVTDHPDKVLPAGMTLKRPKPEPEDDRANSPTPSTSKAPGPPPKKSRLELSTAECVLCPFCEFISLSSDGVLRHVKETHPSRYQEMVNSEEENMEVECGDCCVKFSGLDKVRAHMHGSHGTSRFVLQAIPVTENEVERTDSPSDVEELSDECTRSSTSSTPCYPRSYRDEPESESDYPTSPLSNGVATDSGLDVASHTTSVEDVDAFEGSAADTEMTCDVRGCDVVLSASKMSIHRACHELDGFVCTQCGLREKMWGPMALHLWRLHQIDLGLKQCPHCDFRHYRFVSSLSCRKVYVMDVVDSPLPQSVTNLNPVFFQECYVQSTLGGVLDIQSVLLEIVFGM